MLLETALSPEHFDARAPESFAPETGLQRALLRQPNRRSPHVKQRFTDPRRPLRRTASTLVAAPRRRSPALRRRAPAPAPRAASSRAATARRPSAPPEGALRRSRAR